jgi:uncharacterized protein (DUF3820 family)
MNQTWEEEINTHNLIIDFGKYAGERWTRIPKSYLEWLVNQPEDMPQFAQHKLIAKSEIERRGETIKSDVEITPHAIDKASIRHRKIWHETALNQEEGLYSWLKRVADEALRCGKKGQGKIKYLGIKFVFKWGNNYPILKTVM